MTTTDEEYLTAGGGSDTEVEGKASHFRVILPVLKLVLPKHSKNLNLREPCETI